MMLGIVYLHVSDRVSRKATVLAEKSFHDIMRFHVSLEVASLSGFIRTPLGYEIREWLNWLR